jgi:hypothetical protein
MTKKLFLSAKSWIFTSVILWGADNKIEKKATLSQKTRVVFFIFIAVKPNWHLQTFP